MIIEKKLNGPRKEETVKIARSAAGSGIVASTSPESFTTLYPVTKTPFDTTTPSGSPIPIDPFTPGDVGGSQITVKVFGGEELTITRTPQGQSGRPGISIPYDSLKTLRITYFSEKKLRRSQTFEKQTKTFDAFKFFWKVLVKNCSKIILAFVS